MEHLLKYFFGQLATVVGIPVTRYPPHRSGRALVSASGYAHWTQCGSRWGGNGCLLAWRP